LEGKHYQTLDEGHLHRVPTPLEGAMSKDLSGLVIGGDIPQPPESAKEILAELICTTEAE
jgi:hypothetical protein